MASGPAGVEQPIRFGEGCETDLRPRRLSRGSHVLKLERICSAQSVGMTFRDSAFVGDNGMNASVFYLAKPVFGGQRALQRLEPGRRHAAVILKLLRADISWSLPPRYVEWMRALRLGLSLRTNALSSPGFAA